MGKGQGEGERNSAKISRNSDILLASTVTRIRPSAVLIFLSYNGAPVRLMFCFHSSGQVNRSKNKFLLRRDRSWK